MTHVVVTKEGALHHGPFNYTQDEVTEEQANALAAESNRKAEELGIKTRYEVKAK